MVLCKAGFCIHKRHWNSSIQQLRGVWSKSLITIRSTLRYSTTSIEQAQEQINNMVLREWLVAPRTLVCWNTRLNCINKSAIVWTDDGSQEIPHHAEGSISQYCFRNHVTNFMNVVHYTVNSFEESSKNQVTLDNTLADKKPAVKSVQVL